MDSESPKLRSIAAKGKELFWKYGIRKVSVEEICKEAGVSKMTYYKFFKNKNSLVIYIIEELYKEQMVFYRQFWENNTSMEKIVEKTIQMKLANTNNISMEFIRDMYKSEDKELIDFFRHLTDETLEMVRYDYREAQDKGLIRSDLSIDFIMYAMNHIAEIVSDEKLISLYSESSTMLRDVLEFFYYGIMPRNNHLSPVNMPEESNH